MNITVTSLIYSALLAPSPAFISNRLYFSTCKFQKFTSLLFYNQKELNIKNTVFAYGLNSVIRNDHEITQKDQHIDIKEETFSNENYYEKKTGSFSISIVECSFLNIIKKQSILIEGDKLSVYITQCYFYQCNPSDSGGVILLQRSRCLTLTHTCALECKGVGNKGFLYYDCIESDFSLFLYNSISKTTYDVISDSRFNIFCKSGSQYFRCNNMTSVTFNAYQFEAPYCFSFGMNTVVDCSESCMHLTGYKTGECSGAFDKTISNVNFFTSSSDKPIFYIDLKCEYSLTIENSVLLANNRNDKVYIVSKSNDCKFIQFIFINCLLNHGVTVDGAIYQADNRFEYYDTKHVMVLPHYTHNGCDGPKDIAKNTDAYGCNAGNCVDLICNRTIGFPDGVVTYTTIIHTDLQTATFTPSKSFTFSDKFSESNKFSKSFAFSNSDHFTSSEAFSKTNYFTHSSAFTFTGRFSK